MEDAQSKTAACTDVRAAGRTGTNRSASKLLFASLMLVALMVAPSASGQNNFFLRANDRVVFYGDSITQQGFYCDFVETYTISRFPNLNVRFFNSGWSGEWIVGGGGGTVDQRLARDVVALQPTVAVFMVGMNDAAYQDFDQSFLDVYTKGYQHLLDSLRQSSPNLRITLLEPSPFDDVTRPVQYALRGGYNKVIVRYGKFVRELALQRGIKSVDMNAPLVGVLEKAHAIDPALTEKIIPDRIHPSAAGGLVMATELLNAWNAPGVVSSVEISASPSKVIRSENTQVTALENKQLLSWNQLDNALPLPIDPEDKVMALALRSSNVVETLDQQLLKITGLADARYCLKIDDLPVGCWNSIDFAHGINLALLPTPMLKQALVVHAFTLRHTALRLARWQGVQVALEKENSVLLAEALKALDVMEDDLLKQQRDAVIPIKHHYELTPQATP